MLLFPASILFQILRINLAEGDELRALWSSQTLNYIPIAAERGSIYDSNGSRMAGNSIGYTVAVDPGAPGVSAEGLAELSRILSRHTGRSSAWYRNRIRNAPAHSRYIVLSRSIGAEAYDDIMKADLRG